MTGHKTTAKKAAPRKTAKAAEAVPESQDEQRPEGGITFKDRAMRVQMPSPEQILVWKRTLVQLEKANLNDWNGEQVLAALERTRKIIDSVLLDQDDVDWLDDEMLAGRVGLKDCAQIVLDTVSEFQNRQQRRTAKKAAPARRKKAS